MEEQILTLIELSKKLKLNQTTLRTWMGNFRFDKYRLPRTYPPKFIYNKDFLLELKDYVERKPSSTAHKLYFHIERLLGERL